MKIFLVFIAVLVSHCLAAKTSKYCDFFCEDYSTNTIIQNIGCKHTNLFDKQNCPSNAKMVDITSELKDVLVDGHNQHRNNIAGGSLKGYKPACRMASMEWDDDLAYLAELNVKQCDMRHDKCHSTDDFKYSGQSLHWANKSPVGAFNYREQFKKAMQNWFDEHKICSQAIIDRFPEATNKKIGHFTVMVADRNIRVGCGAATYDKEGFTNFLLACNYATTNMPKFPIYASCASAGKDCKKGRNPKYPNLCSKQEVFDVNKWPCVTSQHIGCNHDESFDISNCPKNAKMVTITEPLKQLLVDAHNKYRNHIARGGDRNHRPACRMATMEWDDKLAYLASLNVRQCEMRHDRCHRTKDFVYSGQNLEHSWHFPAGDFDYSKELAGAVYGWFSEVVNSTQAIVDSYPEHPRKKFGHFTVMMADRNTRLGCADATYDIDGWSYILTACNYATTNMRNKPIYAKCHRGGAGCTKGRNPRYTNLCSINEEYDVNNWF